MKTRIVKTLKWLAISLGALLGLVVISIAIFIWQRPWYPFMDDGPFKGEPVNQLPSRSPDQVYLLSKYKLEVFNRAPNQKAPIVVLRDSNDQVKWSIYATGMNNTEVQSIEFIDHRTILSTTVRGTVKWTYGNEATWWYVSRDGELEEYWYSW